MFGFGVVFFTQQNTGMVDVSCTLWLIYCKNTSQQRRPIQFNPLVMYRGYPMALINASVLIGSQFLVTGIASKIITNITNRPLGDMESILAACIGGGVSGFLCGPTELTLIQVYSNQIGLMNRMKFVFGFSCSPVFFVFLNLFTNDQLK